MITISKSFYETITKSTKKFNIIQVLESIEPDNGSYFLQFESDNHTLEIGISKSVYLKLFKESHTLWHNYYIQQIDKNVDFLDNCSQEELWKLYYMTVGYLITTNEHNTIIRLHEVLVMKLTNIIGISFIVNELKLVSSFTTSRLQRINKSSSLWFLMKKLSIFLIFDSLLSDSNQDLTYKRYINIIDSCLLSCRIHYANYYASYFLRFCLRINSIIFTLKSHNVNVTIIKDINSYILDNLKCLCKEKLTDISLWGALNVYFAEQIYLADGLFLNNSSNHCYVIEEYNKCKTSLEKQTNLTFNSLSISSISIDVDQKDQKHDNIVEELNELILWLLKVKCDVYSPYKLILSLYCDLKIHLHSYKILKNAILSERKNAMDKLKIIEKHNVSLYEKNSQYIETLDAVVSTYFN